MTILALEFSSQERSVAVSRGGTVLAEAVEAGGRRTAAFALIEEVLGRAKIEREDIEMIAVGLGPGSYTGVRASIALAQGWQLGRPAKTAGLGSLAAIAMQAQSAGIFGRVNVVVDAQREEFYLAVFDIAEQALVEVEGLKIVPRFEVHARMKSGQIILGPEAEKFSPAGRTVYPRAAAISVLAARQGCFLPPEKLAPIYLRETNFVKAPIPSAKPSA